MTRRESYTTMYQPLLGIFAMMMVLPQLVMASSSPVENLLLVDTHSGKRVLPRNLKQMMQKKTLNPTNITAVGLDLGRHWTDIAQIYSTSPSSGQSTSDDLRGESANERDPFFFTMQPSSAPSLVPSTSHAPSSKPSPTPSLSPSDSPSALPSANPSREPSGRPSFFPSDTPSMVASQVPSVMPNASPSIIPSMYPTASPTSIPSSSPTQDPFPPQPAPSFPPWSYFDYRTSLQANRGVQNWGNVYYSDEGRYWSEFKEWIPEDLNTNQCESGSIRQSPIDVSFKTSMGFCREYHEIRHKVRE